MRLGWWAGRPGRPLVVVTPGAPSAGACCLPSAQRLGWNSFSRFVCSSFVSNLAGHLDPPLQPVFGKQGHCLLGAPRTVQC